MSIKVVRIMVNKTFLEFSGQKKRYCVQKRQKITGGIGIFQFSLVIHARQEKFGGQVLSKGIEHSTGNSRRFTPQKTKVHTTIYKYFRGPISAIIVGIGPVFMVPT